MNGVYGSMIELQIINYAFAHNSVKFFIENGVNGDYFTTYRPHYEFLMSFCEQYQQLPSKETFNSKFVDNWEWVTVNDPQDYLLEKLEEAKLYRDLISEYKEIGNLIKAEKSDKAVEKMATISQKFLKQKKTDCIDLIDDAKIRFNEYVERVNNPDKAFVTTGLDELDDILGGWDMKNESALICARTGFGKSWWLIYFALQAAKTGLRVGFYSGEMELDLVGYRMDTFLGNIANGSLTHGNGSIREQYENYIETLNKVVTGHIFCLTPDMCGGSVTTSKLRAFIEKYDIQMMCIDQFSLLNDENGAKNPREQAVNISKDLRNIQRLLKIPMLIAVQLNREENENGPSTRNISESDRIGQDATTVLFIERKMDNVIISVGKSRNAKTGDKLTYAWNINMGLLHYIPTDNDAKNGVGSKVVEDDYINDSGKSDSVF